MRVDISRLVIGAPASGSGKSTVATGLMAALSRDQVVQGFKVGPDYIDPGYHTAATGRVSRNLDTWMSPISQVEGTFARAVQGADIAVIEGVMGLFDGYDAMTESGSTAEVAKLFHAPVILVLDVGKMARSAGALALGYRDFDPALNVAGVICNNIGSEKHALWVTQAIEAIGLPVLGWLPRESVLHVPERHLGLYTAIERATEIDTFLQRAAELVAQHIDLKQLRSIAGLAPSMELYDTLAQPPETSLTRIAVAGDEAFCFYYEDNFDWLRAAGAELIFFSPLRDAALPEGIGGLYLGGGYPELYAEQLAANTSLIQTIRSFVDARMPVYAECGGLMFLTESITDLNGRIYPMAGVVPGRAQMAGCLTMGYREVKAAQNTLLLACGGRTRGHEFHYSDWIDRPDDLSHAYEIVSRPGETVRAEGYARENLLASYIHLHFSANLDLARNFVCACARRQEGTLVS
ncbi:MAG: cobyrinate a,c-diamide synthase [Anaerolineae bacterium]|nr:cobyrinate a,c-diamide synthase [Anaerolineae bacterium]